MAPVLARANPTSTPSTLQPPGKDEDEDVYIYFVSPTKMKMNIFCNYF